MTGPKQRPARRKIMPRISTATRSAGRWWSRRPAQRATEGSHVRAVMARIWTAALAAVAIVGGITSAFAQSYPNRPITLVVPLPPGGTNDIMARIVGERMSKTLGQQVVIENRAAGGSGTVATRQVARSTPDGYTILLSYTSTFATGPSMYKNAG